MGVTNYLLTRMILQVEVRIGQLMNQLLPVVTWTDHPNGGHLTPEKVTNQTCKSLGHDRKFTWKLELDDMTILFSCFPKKVVGHYLRRNNRVAFSKDFRLSDHAFQGVYIFSPMGFPRSPRTCTFYETSTPYMLWNRHLVLLTICWCKMLVNPSEVQRHEKQLGCPVNRW